MTRSMSQIKNTLSKSLGYASLVCLPWGSLIAQGSEGLFSAEELEYFQEKAPCVEETQLNSIGRARVQKQHSVKNTSLQVAFYPSLGGEGIAAEESVDELPFEVDNSQLPFFPPIGNDEGVRSSVAFATTYYQASHEIALLNGYNQQTSSKHILSPSWTYNLLNKGKPIGISVSAAYTLLEENGAPSIESVPYRADNIQGWFWGVEDWLSAMHYRMAPVQVIRHLDTDASAIDTLKRALNNGHVITVGTYFGSWQEVPGTMDPEGVEERYGTDRRVSYMKGEWGGPHFVTIVGYNDNIWVDLNGNGVVDPGERGAFLVANSRGTSYGNQGFMWISYDAFRSTSAVIDGVDELRVPFASASGHMGFKLLPKAYHYAPKLAGQFTLFAHFRASLDVQGGVSDSTQGAPQTLFSTAALNMYYGGLFRFDGTKEDAFMSGTFALDFTDCLPSVPESVMQRFYLNLRGRSNEETALQSFCLLDLQKRKRVDLAEVPIDFTLGAACPYVEYNFQCGLAPSGSTELSLPVQPIAPAFTVTLPEKDFEVVSGMYPFTVDTQYPLGVECIHLSIGSEKIVSLTEPPYSVLFDTSTLPSGVHTLEIEGIDRCGGSHKKQRLFVIP